MASQHRGDFGQNLTLLPRGLHNELHSMIEAKLKMAGLPVRQNGRFLSSEEWTLILKNDDAKQKAFNALADATREFDKINGTKVMGDLWKNVFNP
jgi:hypothetical protein